MEVEACRQAVARLPLTVAMLDSLRKTARLLSTHYSTQIEGNRLSPSQVEQVLAGGGKFPGRERDEIEVRNYYRAVEFVEGLVDDPKPLTERLVHTIHGLVLSGKKKPTAYRDGQNVIRDSGSGRIIYLPPEAQAVPKLMAEFFRITSRSAAALCKRRLEEEFVVLASPSKKARRYQFADQHDSLVEKSVK